MPDTNRVKSSFALWPNTYKENDRHPDITGVGTITPEFAKKIHEIVYEHGEIEIPVRTAAWFRKDKAGKDMTSGSMEIDEKKLADVVKLKDDCPV